MIDQWIWKGKTTDSLLWHGVTTTGMYNAMTVRILNTSDMLAAVTIFHVITLGYHAPIHKAWEKSFEKWQMFNKGLWLAYALGAKSVYFHTQGTQTCGFCNMYFYEECEGCPVVEVTKGYLCRNLDEVLFIESWENRDISRDRIPKFIQASQKVINFLNSDRLREECMLCANKDHVSFNPSE